MGTYKTVVGDCEVFCVGNVVADLVLRPVNSLPDPGTVRMVEQAELVIGGNGANTASALAKLGVRARLAGAVGDDRLGQMLRDALRGHGVDDCGLVTLDRSSTSITAAMVHDGGERSLMHLLGANAVFSYNHIDWAQVEGARLFHYASAFLLPAFDGEPMVSALERARSLGCTISLDFSWDTQGRWLDMLAPALPFIDIMFATFEEGKALTGEGSPEGIARCLRSLGVGAVVVKLGAGGCYVDCRDRTFLSDGFRVDAKDTTGAGDCFAAGFLSVLLRGGGYEEAARFANAAAALSTLGMGGGDAAPAREQVLALLREDTRE